MQNINTVVITGNLTKDPELRYTGGGTAICEARIAVNGRRKDGAEWVDKANYFDVVVFGARAEAIVQHLSKGSPLAIEGRLDHQEWEAKDGSGKRQAVKIIAGGVQFLGSRPKDSDDATVSPAEDREPVGVGAGEGDDDIPF